MGPLVYMHLLMGQADRQTMTSRRVHLALVLRSTCRIPPFQPDTAPCLPLFTAASGPQPPQPSPQPSLVASLFPCILSFGVLNTQLPQFSSPFILHLPPQAPFLGCSGHMDELCSFTSDGRGARSCHLSSPQVCGSACGGHTFARGSKFSFLRT